MARALRRADGLFGTGLAASVVDKPLGAEQPDRSRATGAYFSATGLPDASVTFAQAFSTAPTTLSGMGT